MKKHSMKPNLDYLEKIRNQKREIQKEKIYSLMKMKNKSIANQGSSAEIQTTADILNLVNQVTEERKKIGFELKSHLGDFKYLGETLTPLYLLFVKDIFHQKFGPVTKSVIEAFGDTLKTNRESFPESYIKQKTSIKEVIEGSLYIHTNMSSLTMKKYIIQISEQLGCVVKFRDPKKDELMDMDVYDSEIPF